MPQTPLDKDFGGRARHTFRGGSRPARADTCQEGELNEEPIVPSSAALLREPPPREVPMSQVEVSEQVSPHGDADPASLQPPEASKEGQVTFPGRRSQPGIAAVEVDTPLTVDKNQNESVFHIRVGRQRPATIVRVADHMLVELDKQSRIAGLWLLDVPPFPNVEATA